MKNIPFITLFALFLLAACQPSSTIPTLTVVQDVVPSPAPVNPSNAPPVISPAAPTADEPLYLRILWPEDGSLVSTPEIELLGEASPGAVVSIGDEIILVPPDGAFRQIIRLEEGPNAIEVVASNIAGDEQSLILTLVYEP